MDNIENKSASTVGIADAFGDFMHAFETFKTENDQRLCEIESRKSVDVLTDEKLERINLAIDDHQRSVDALMLKAARPGRGAGGFVSGVAGKHRQAFDGYIRKGDAVDLRQLEEKALSAGTDPDGGYLVPDETENSVMNSLKDISPIRSIAGVRQVSGAVFKKPFSISGPGTGWVGETDARPETSTPTLAELTFPTMELYAMPAATPTLLDDAVVNIDEWIAGEVSAAFAEQEGAAFISGDGVNKPRGFLDYTKIDNASWSWGNVGYVATGTDGAFDGSAPVDDLIDLVYSVKAGYRSNAHWVMNRATQAEIRKIKDADGNYIWQPSAAPGAAPTLLNTAIVEAEDMPDIASDSFAIAYGDFNRGYLIVDRLGIRVLRDPYSSKPYVLFYTTKRVGGGIQDFDAIKLMKFGIS